MVGAVRFELTTSCTRNKRASRATLRPEPPISCRGQGQNATSFCDSFLKFPGTISRQADYSAEFEALAAGFCGRGLPAYGIRMILLEIKCLNRVVLGEHAHVFDLHMHLFAGLGPELLVLLA